MSKQQLTEMQKAVVDHEKGALLVSAAAGSGKTKVLVDRILQKICDPASGCNIDDFLIITFTNAAAAELRAKIAKEIRTRLAEDGANQHLKKQLTRIFEAEISTVHAYCGKVLRDYAYQLNIPADFRIADDVECEKLRERAMQDTLAHLYDNLDQSLQFKSLLHTLGYSRDDRRISALILMTYENVQSHAWPKIWIDYCKDALTAGKYDCISKTPWAEFLLHEMQEALNYHLEQMQTAVSLICAEPALAKYVAVFSDNLEMLRRLKDRFSWDALAECGALDFGRLPPIPKCEAWELQDKVKKIRTFCKDDLNKRLQAFAVDEKVALAELEGTYPALQGLLEVTEYFSERFQSLKRNQRIFDFADLEHEAVKLLVDRYTGLPTETAREISERFTEILVDEYQDTNEVQDTIFRAVSKNGSNLFMVGDVKQSIYRFRLADPGIFLKKYNTFEQRDNRGDTPRKIILSTNFRSRPEILEAVNHVFKTAMSPEVGEINYGPDEQLSTIREFAATKEPMTELHLMDVDRDRNDLELGRKEEVEARFVAEKIQEFLDGNHYVGEGDERRVMRPGDIAILMRSLSSTAPIFARELNRKGIAVSANRAEDIFQSTEVCTLLAFLNIVNNPHQDIPLITALASPVGGYTADDLAQIRSIDRSLDMYDALCKCAKCDEKRTAFLQFLRDLREKRSLLDLRTFLSYVFEKTDIVNVFSVMNDGFRRKENLRSFEHLCENAVSLGISNLTGFLRYIDTMRKTGYMVQMENDESDGVKIMSVHKSKGLEFPVVFLCDLSRRFNMESAQQPVLTDTELMLASDVFDCEKMVHYPGTAKLAIARKKRKEMISEEMRVLYVAMTRARERLIMTFCSAGLESKVQQITENAAFPLPPFVAGMASCPGDWILYAAAVLPEARHIFGGAGQCVLSNAYSWKVRYHETVQVEDLPASVTDVCAAQETIAAVPCLSQMRGDTTASQIPAKITATQIKGRFQDHEAEEFAGGSVQNKRVRITNHSSRSADGRYRGTATHLFMQYCRFGKLCDASWLADEKNRLSRYAYMSQQEIDAVDDDKVLALFRSPVGELITSNKVEREFKFSVLVDAGKYFSVPAGCGEIMLQGVVDCIVFGDDGLTVIDYKTDRITPDEVPNRSEFYRPQLEAYSTALEEIYEKPVVRKLVYYFETNTYYDL